MTDEKEPGRFAAVLEKVDNRELTAEDYERYLAARRLAEQRKREIYGPATGEPDAGHPGP